MYDAHYIYYCNLTIILSFLFGQAVSSAVPEAIANGTAFTALSEGKLEGFLMGSQGYLHKMRVSTSMFYVSKLKNSF